jgi:hypothetical protein
MIIEFNAIYEAIGVTLSAQGVQNQANRFPGRPSGIIIEDTVNNLAMPIPHPILDTNIINIQQIHDQYVALYSGDTNDYSGILPWHFIIEFYNRDYIIYNTRPTDLSYVYTTEETRNLVKTNNRHILNASSKTLLDSSTEFKNFIHVLIIGNSDLDVYSKKLYMKIDEFIIGPMSRQWKFAPTLNSNIFLLNLGKHFLPGLLNHHLKA